LGVIGSNVYDSLTQALVNVSDNYNRKRATLRASGANAERLQNLSICWKPLKPKRPNSSLKRYAEWFEKFWIGQSAGKASTFGNEYEESSETTRQTLIFVVGDDIVHTHGKP
jgi:hypothetical protein